MRCKFQSRLLLRFEAKSGVLDKSQSKSDVWTAGGRFPGIDGGVRRRSREFKVVRIEPDHERCRCG